jgi:hypothetical protein
MTFSIFTSTFPSKPDRAMVFSIYVPYKPLDASKKKYFVILSLTRLIASNTFNDV